MQRCHGSVSSERASILRDLLPGGAARWQRAVPGAERWPTRDLRWLLWATIKTEMRALL